MSRRDEARYHRRGARRTRRHMRGGYPVLIAQNPYQPAAAIALAALGRLVYRHRSAFAPFAITGTLFVLAAMAHAHHARLWILTAVLTLTAGLILGMPHQLIWRGRKTPAHAAGLITRLWEACGISRTPERVYAATVLCASGAWLSAATALGPATRPLPLLALIVTVVLGVPWWVHRRRRARVRIERTVQSWPDLAEGMGLSGSRITSAVGDTWGYTARVILRKGTPAAHAIGQVPAIESGLGVRPGSVRAIPDPARADAVIVRVIETDPHARPVPWPGQAATTIHVPCVLGVSEDGRPVLVSLLRRNVLIGGTTGAGKSGLVNVEIAYLVACIDVELWGIDLKGGMELQPWAGSMTRLATTPRQATALLASGVTILDQRAAGLAGTARVLEPSPEHKAIVIVTDEYAELPPEALEHSDSLARRGRAVAITQIAATQKPTQAAMGNTAARSQMDIRICTRVRERRDGDLILGQGMISSGWRPDLLARPGEFLISSPDHQAPDRARAYLITDAQISRHAAAFPAPRDAGWDDPGTARPGAPRWPQDAGWAPPGTSSLPAAEDTL